MHGSGKLDSLVPRHDKPASRHTAQWRDGQHAVANRASRTQPPINDLAEMLLGCGKSATHEYVYTEPGHPLQHLTPASAKQETADSPSRGDFVGAGPKLSGVQGIAGTSGDDTNLHHGLPSHAHVMSAQERSSRVSLRQRSRLRAETSPSRPSRGHF